MGAYVYRRTPLRDATYPDRRREKWDFYLKIAVVRFEAWISLANNAVEEGVREKGAAVSLRNPVDFQNYCRDKKLSVIRDVEFPWAKIVRSSSTYLFYAMADLIQAQSHRLNDLELQTPRSILGMGQTRMPDRAGPVSIPGECRSHI